MRLRTATSPLSGLTWPTRMRRSVDLPDPFGPISPIRSPSEMVKETFWKSGFAPKDFDSSCALMRGGNEVLSPTINLNDVRIAEFAPAPNPCFARDDEV